MECLSRKKMQLVIIQHSPLLTSCAVSAVCMNGKRWSDKKRNIHSFVLPFQKPGDGGQDHSGYVHSYLVHKVAQGINQNNMGKAVKAIEVISHVEFYKL